VCNNYYKTAIDISPYFVEHRQFAEEHIIDNVPIRDILPPRFIHEISSYRITEAVEQLRVPVMVASLPPAEFQW
jgi:hypothetical protein